MQNEFKKTSFEILQLYHANFLSGNHMPNLKKIMFDFSWHRHSLPFLAYDIPKIIFLAAFFTLL